MTASPLPDEGLPGRYPAPAWLQYTNPEAAGWSAEKLHQAQHYATRIGSAAGVVVYRGALLHTWGDLTRRYRCHRLRQIIVHALYGIYAAEGRLRLDKTLDELGINDEPSLTAPEKKARLIDLLQGRSGVLHAAAYEGQTQSRKAAQDSTDQSAEGVPIQELSVTSASPAPPWRYSSWDINILAAVFEKETGEKIYDAFQQRLALPLGLEDFRLVDTYYHHQQAHSRYPAAPCRMSTRDLARLGWLYAQQGRWGTEQLIPSTWIEQSTRPHTRLEGNADPSGQRVKDRQSVGLSPTRAFTEPAAYGYLWWVYGTGGPYKENAFSVFNAGGHSLEVSPEDELVIIHRADSYQDRKVSLFERAELSRLLLKARQDPSVIPPELTPIALEPDDAARTEFPQATMERYVGTFELLDHNFRAKVQLALHQESLALVQPSGERFPLKPLSASELFVEDMALHIYLELDSRGLPKRLTTVPPATVEAAVEIRDDQVMAGQWSGTLMDLAGQSGQLQGLVQNAQWKEARQLVQSQPVEAQAALVMLDENPEQVLSLTGMGTDGKPQYSPAVVERLPTETLTELIVPHGTKFIRFNEAVLQAMSPQKLVHTIEETLDPVHQPELRLQVLDEWLQALSHTSGEKTSQVLRQLDMDLLEEAVMDRFEEMDLTESVASSGGFGVSRMHALQSGASASALEEFKADPVISRLFGLLHNVAPDLLQDLLERIGLRI